MTQGATACFIKMFYFQLFYAEYGYSECKLHSVKHLSQLTVNQLVGGSNPSRGAILPVTAMNNLYVIQYPLARTHFRYTFGQAI